MQEEIKVLPILSHCYQNFMQGQALVGMQKQTMHA